MSDSEIKSESKLNPEEYIAQFGVLGIDEYINSDNMAQILYNAFLNKFKIQFSSEEYEYFQLYQNRVFELAENLRELPIDTIKLVFDYIDQKNHYLTDNIIMSWSLPRPDTFFSKQMYNNQYKKNISLYNNKLVQLADQRVIMNFCIDTFSKTNSVPIHCIDIMWLYMNKMSIEFAFNSADGANYIDIHTSHDDNDEFIEIGINMKFLVEMGLGLVRTIESNNTFQDLLKSLITDENIIKQFLGTKSKKNYAKQVLDLHENAEKYFGSKLRPLSEEIKLKLKSVN
jgi:hypothetical protein